MSLSLSLYDTESRPRKSLLECTKLFAGRQVEQSFRYKRRRGQVSVRVHTLTSFPVLSASEGFVLGKYTVRHRSILPRETENTSSKQLAKQFSSRLVFLQTARAQQMLQAWHVTSLTTKQFSQRREDLFLAFSDGTGADLRTFQGASARNSTWSEC